MKAPRRRLRRKVDGYHQPDTEGDRENRKRQAEGLAHKRPQNEPNEEQPARAHVGCNTGASSIRPSRRRMMRSAAVMLSALWVANITATPNCRAPRRKTSNTTWP